MTHPYPSVDAAATVNGASIRSVLSAFQSQSQIQALLTQHGLPTDPHPAHWYPVSAWLAVLAEVEAHYGSLTLYAAGLQVVHHSAWPANLRTLPEALAAIQAAHRLNMRGAQIGTYRLESLGERAWRVKCATPAPVAFEHGLLMGLARKFKPADAVRVRVEPEVPPAGSPPHLKWFRVSW